MLLAKSKHGRDCLLDLRQLRGSVVNDFDSDLHDTELCINMMIAVPFLASVDDEAHTHGLELLGAAARKSAEDDVVVNVIHPRVGGGEGSLGGRRRGQKG